MADLLGKVVFSSSLLQGNFMTTDERRRMAMEMIEAANRLQVIQELKALVEHKEVSTHMQAGRQITSLGAWGTGHGAWGMGSIPRVAAQKRLLHVCPESMVTTAGAHTTDLSRLGSSARTQLCGCTRWVAQLTMGS